jgi:hypothetical protein
MARSGVLGDDLAEGNRILTKVNAEGAVRLPRPTVLVVDQQVSGRLFP